MSLSHSSALIVISYTGKGGAAGVTTRTAARMILAGPKRSIANRARPIVPITADRRRKCTCAMLISMKGWCQIPDPLSSKGKPRLRATGRNSDSSRRPRRRIPTPLLPRFSLRRAYCLLLGCCSCMPRLPLGHPSFFYSVLAAFHLLALSVVGSTLPAGFVETDIGTGWSEPAGVAFDPAPERANRVYVWERGGKVWIVGDGMRLATPLIDLSEEGAAWRDLGLLGFALHPDFAQNGYIYLFYDVDRYYLLNAGTPGYDPAASDQTPPTIGRITRYTARASDGYRSVDPASRKILLGETISTGVPVLNESHSIGSLVFANDGTLLATCGDGGSFEVMDDGGDL